METVTGFREHNIEPGHLLDSRTRARTPDPITYLPTYSFPWVNVIFLALVSVARSARHYPTCLGTY
jgi:hypothetical protein